MKKQPTLRYAIISAVVLLALAAGAWASDYFAWFQNRLEPTKEIAEQTIPHATSTEPTAKPYVVEAVATGLDVPWSFVFTAPNRILISERPGKIKALVDGKFADNPVLYQFKEISTTGEEGLMALALDPNYVHNKIVYAAVAYKNQGMWVKVVTLVDEGNRLVLGKTIIDKIPAAQYHAGTALSFGPDGKLYVSTGDATDRTIAQDLNSMGGKILRLNPDGTIPKDNPFPNTAVYSYGHRNPQGLAWLNGKLYESEHGPSIFDGPAGGDEINLISAGKNYGWPLVSHGKTKEGTEAALKVFTPAEAPASLLAYTGKALPQFTGNLFFGALKGEGLVRLVIDPKDPTKITSVEKMGQVKYGRIRAVVQGPDGFIYFSTSNLDGRGTPADTDDRIFRIRPE